MPFWPDAELGEIVLADVELHLQIVQVGERHHVALGALVAHETGGDEFALFDGALQDGAVTGARITVFSSCVSA